MSLLVHKPSNVEIDRGIFDKCCSDGSSMFGVSYAKDGKLFIKKNFKSKDTFFTELSKLKEVSAIIHFAREPAFEKINYCGPYRLDENHAMMHDGNIWNYQDLQKKGHSQSLNLLIQIKKFWEPSFFGKEYLNYMIEKALPYSNRVIIINNLGQVQIFNKSSGDENKNLWLSNRVYFGPPTWSAPSKPVNPPASPLSNYGGGQISYKRVCSFCKKSFFPPFIRQGSTGFICQDCEKQVNNVTLYPNQSQRPGQNQPGQSNRIIVPHDFKKTNTEKKTEFLEGLRRTCQLDVSFLEVFAVI